MATLPPVPYHTGGRGAIRTLDKGFHRVERRCDINRYVSVAIGDSGAANPSLSRHLLRRIEAALNHNRPVPELPNPPLPLMRVVPGTICVKSRFGEGLNGFDSDLWTVAKSLGFPEPEELPSVAAFPFLSLHWAGW